MVDVNSLAHRYYLADLERSAQSRPARRRRGDASAHALAAALRLLNALRRGEVRRG